MPPERHAKHSLTVQVDVSRLPRMEVALLRRFLLADKLVLGVEECVPCGGEDFHHELMLVVEFLHTHAPAIEATVKEYGADVVKGASGAAVTYLIERLRRWKKVMESDFAAIEILGPDENVIKVVKVTKKKKY